jgi:hypothetical protein
MHMRSETSYGAKQQKKDKLHPLREMQKQASQMQELITCMTHQYHIVTAQRRRAFSDRYLQLLIQIN